MRVSVVSIIINTILSIGKVAAGLIAGSGAIISDGVHSASDVFSTIIVIIGFNIAHKESDKKHQYGHERFECIAAMILGAILLATGIGIGLTRINKMIAGIEGNLEAPGRLALFAAAISIAVKEWMYWYTRSAAIKINSGALKADAWHHRSDALSSVGSFIGVLGARIKFPILDPIASIIICLFIVKVSYDIFKDSIYKLIDASCDDETINKIKDIVLSQEGVIELDSLKTRVFGSRIYTDIEISSYGNQSLEEAHNIAQKIHDEVEKNIPMVKHCMVHVNPYKNN
ncbi:MAG: cation diffusion facilitator family transporter [Clostridium sp.]|nr:cation diffusion facilitator family transporter [Clostridium sp.]